MIDVVGVHDGLPLAEAARAALRNAQAIVGSPRQRTLVAGVAENAVALPYPKPLRDGLTQLVQTYPSGLVLLASGDPMFHGIGNTLVDMFGAERIRVHSAPSCASYAAALLGWSSGTPTISLLTGSLDQLARLRTEPRLFVLVADYLQAHAVAKYCEGFSSWFGTSVTVNVLRNVGTPRCHQTTWHSELCDQQLAGDDLIMLAIERPNVHAGSAGQAVSVVPGRPLDTFDHDGQITKPQMRAMTLAALAPNPGELLWDIGTASGSVGIEWCRAVPDARCIGFEVRADRAAVARRNVAALCTGSMDVHVGEAPRVLAGHPAPDAVFLGGATSDAAVFSAAWRALRPGGRLVANAVTVEAQAALAQWHAEFGGSLTQLHMSELGRAGDYRLWRSAAPAWQWHVVKSSETH